MAVVDKIFKNKNIDMTSGKIAPSLLLFTIPLVLGDFLQQLYNMTDSIIVGRIVGKYALGAVGGTTFVINLLIGAFAGISLGATIVLSKRFGAKNQSELMLALDTTMKITGICAVSFTIIGIAIVPLAIKVMALDANIAPLAKQYLTVYFSGISAQLAYNMFAGILRAVGNSAGPLYALCITCILNIGLDLLFVGVFHMGVMGAALATVIAQFIAAIYLIRLIKINPAFDGPIITKSGINIKMAKEIIGIALPNCIYRIVINISNIFVTSHINYFGPDTTSAWAAYNKVDILLVNTSMNLGAAVTTFTAQNIGAKKYERVHKGMMNGIGIIVCITAMYMLIFMPLRYQVIGLFSKDPMVIQIGAAILATIMPWQPIYSISQAVQGALRGRGYNVLTMAIILFCLVFLRQMYLNFWPGVHEDITRVVACWPYTLFISCAVSIITYLIVRKKDGF